MGRFKEKKFSLGPGFKLESPALHAEPVGRAPGCVDGDPYLNPGPGENFFLFKISNQT